MFCFSEVYYIAVLNTHKQTQNHLSSEMRSAEHITAGQDQTRKAAKCSGRYDKDISEAVVFTATSLDWASAEGGEMCA